MQNGTIGVFDSGLGGLTILKEFLKVLPEYDYLYLGDNERAPYGDRNQDEIFAFTKEGVEWLFSEGAGLVILACNTASSNALRRIQQEVLPKKYPEKKVLGIVIPTVEEMEKCSMTKHIGVLATQATVFSRVFEKEAAKRSAPVQVVTESGRDLARLIETNAPSDVLEKEIVDVVTRLVEKDEKIDTLVLGCTHYALIQEEIQRFVDPRIHVVGQGEIVAKSLQSYLERHTEIEKKLRKGGKVRICTTSGEDETKKMMRYFFGEDLDISVACIVTG